MTNALKNRDALTINRALGIIHAGRRKRWRDIAEDSMRLQDLLAENDGELSAYDQREADRYRRQIDDAKADMAAADELIDVVMDLMVREPVARALEAEAQTA